MSMTKDQVRSTEEALRLALEALENITSVSICEATHHAKKDRHLLCEECPNEVRHLKAITAIKAALLSRSDGEAKDEPVAWMRTSGTGSPVVTEALLIEMPEMRWNFQQPLYTTPPQRTWVGLTAEEREQVQAESYGKVPHHVALIAAVEAKLKEKNT